MNESKQELLRGTLDMLILKIVALDPSHATLSPNVFSKSPKNSSRSIKARSIPPSIV